jgi:hypothetical protein
MVKHEPELHTRVGKQIGNQKPAHKPEGLEHDDESPPDQGLE